MLERFRGILTRLRAGLDRDTEDSYKKRDEAESGSRAESYAGGEARAYGEAADEVRKAKDELDKPA